MVTPKARRLILFRGAVSLAGMSGTAAVGDQDGTGAPDLVAIERSTGSLYRYYGPHFTGGSRVRIGIGGWNTLADLSSPRDLTGDGVPDLLAVDAASGDLYTYAGPSVPGGTRTLTGYGW